MSIADSLARLEEGVRAACDAAGRPRREVTLVAVSKTRPESSIREAHAAGIEDFGENRVQELAAKARQLDDLDIRWHLVGPLQTNKVKQVIPRLHLLHSLDRPGLVREIERRAPGPVDALIQINVTGEAAKSGVHPDGLFELIDAALGTDKVNLTGFMTIGPLGGNPPSIQAAFRRLARLREDARRRYPQLSFPILSMGMSDDFEIAIAEGATHIRIGSRVFGMRAGT